MRNVLVGGRHLILLQVNPKLVDYLRYQFASERRCCFYSFIYPFIDNNYFSLESEKLANKIGIIQNMPTWFSARLHGQFPMFLAIEFPVAFLSGGSYFEGHAFAKSLLTASFPSSSSKKIEMVFLEEFILPSIISLYQLYSSKLFAIPLLQTMLEYFGIFLTVVTSSLSLCSIRSVDVSGIITSLKPAWTNPSHFRRNLTLRHGSVLEDNVICHTYLLKLFYSSVISTLACVCANLNMTNSAGFVGAIPTKAINLPLSISFCVIVVLSTLTKNASSAVVPIKAPVFQTVVRNWVKIAFTCDHNLSLLGSITAR